LDKHPPPFRLRTNLGGKKSRRKRNIRGGEAMGRLTKENDKEIVSLMASYLRAMEIIDGRG